MLSSLYSVLALAALSGLSAGAPPGNAASIDKLLGSGLLKGFCESYAPGPAGATTTKTAFNKIKAGRTKVLTKNVFAEVTVTVPGSAVTVSSFDTQTVATETVGATVTDTIVVSTSVTETATDSPTVTITTGSPTITDTETSFTATSFTDVARRFGRRAPPSIPPPLRRYSPEVLAQACAQYFADQTATVTSTFVRRTITTGPPRFFTVTGGTSTVEVTGSPASETTVVNVPVTATASETSTETQTSFVTETVTTTVTLPEATQTVNEPTTITTTVLDTLETSSP